MTQNSHAPTSVAWAEKQLDVCGAQISYLVAGSGPPVVVLPRDNGHPPKHEFLDLLAERFTVYYPWLPGFHGGHPEQWEWLLNARDLAVVMRQFVDGVAFQCGSQLPPVFGDTRSIGLRHELQFQIGVDVWHDVL